MRSISSQAVRLLASACDVLSCGTNGQISQWGGMKAGTPPVAR